MISFEVNWLSDTPDIPGSRYEGLGQSSCPRIAQRALLKIKRQGKIIAFINTHLDHQGQKARYRGAEQLVQMIGGLEAVGFMTGDFNALPDSDEMIMLSKRLKEIGWRDGISGIDKTFHGFGKREPKKIDYIFSNAGIVRAYTADEKINGTYVSDHIPICLIAAIDL